MKLLTIQTSLKEIEQIGLECSNCGSITLVSLEKSSDFKRCGVCAKAISAPETEIFNNLKYIKNNPDYFNLVFVGKQE